MYKPIPTKTIRLTNSKAKLSNAQNRWAKGIAGTASKWLGGIKTTKRK